MRENTIINIAAATAAAAGGCWLADGASENNAKNQPTV